MFATKVTGDENVPAGKPTFRATMVGRQADGAGHIADAGYQNPRWVSGHLSVITNDLIAFSWSGGRPLRLTRNKQ